MKLKNPLEPGVRHKSPGKDARSSVCLRSRHRPMPSGNRGAGRDVPRAEVGSAPAAHAGSNPEGKALACPNSSALAGPVGL